MITTTRVEPLRARIRNRERLLGTFVKTPAHSIVETLGLAGLDFIVLDAEHAPFDRSRLDTCLLAARAAALPALVRLAESGPASVLDALDLGATGVLVPHALDVDGVRGVIASARYRHGSRGFSNSPRAGEYGRLCMADLVDAADRTSAVLCQIEDREAVARIEAITAIDEVDCLFIGRADLAVSLRVFDVNHPDVQVAVERVCAACAAAGKAVGLFLADAADIAVYERLGATLFVIGSDQSFVRAQAKALVAQFRV